MNKFYDTENQEICGTKQQSHTDNTPVQGITVLQIFFSCATFKTLDPLLYSHWTHYILVLQSLKPKAGVLNSFVVWA